MKYSIVIPVFNALQHLIPCIDAVRKHTKNFELILVDDLSTDGAREFVCHESRFYDDTEAFLHQKNGGFAQSVNTGICASKADFIILLNSDTIVTPGWADSLHSTFARAEKDFNLNRVGMVGPVSNFAGGEQGIKFDKYSLDQLDVSCLDHRKTFQNSMQITGFLSGFCVMIRRDLIHDIGQFDCRFKKGFWEDNDFCLRAQLSGWSLIIDYSTFIHHHGSASFRNLPINPDYLLKANQMTFFEKYYSSDSKKLVSIIRTHNHAVYLGAALQRASQFSDEIIVLLDRCTDSSFQIARSYEKVVELFKMNDGFNESRDRQWLIDKASEHDADWVFSFDADEIIEDAFTYDFSHRLMNPVDPQILAYGLNFKTFFLGQTHYRTDGTFGGIWGIRFWRTIKDQKIQSSGHGGLHCTHSPPIPSFNVRRLRIRVKHYGYDSDKKCASKFVQYSSLDPNPDLVKTSPVGYNHIISDSISLNRWKPVNDITLCMIVRNEETNLLTFLSRYYSYFDDVVIVDTGSKDFTSKVSQLFNVRFFKHKWKDSFSEARNFAIEQCTTRWILSMDPDEEIVVSDMPTLWDMIEEDVHAWLFKVLNYQKDGSAVFSDNVRLFRNIPELRWSWRAHENMAPSITKHKLTCLTSPFTIRHYGFLKTGSDRGRKLIQYGDLLKRQIKDFPKEPIGYFHLAFHEFEEGHFDRGMKLLKKSVALKSDFFLAHKEIGLRYLRMALDYISKSADSTPPSHYYYEWIQGVKKSLFDIINQNLDVS